jgi:hypothetical protein
MPRVLLFEHVNLNVSRGRLPEAHTFFIGGLGLANDPRPRDRGRETTLLWANLGLCQFHLPEDDLGDGDVDDLLQRIPGDVTLAISPGSAGAALSRLQQFGIKAEALSETIVRASGPCCDFILSEVSDTEAAVIARVLAQNVGQPEMSQSSALGIRELRVRVHRADLPIIAKFWSDIIQVDGVVLTKDRVSIPGGPEGYDQAVVFFCGGETEQLLSGDSTAATLPHAPGPNGGGDAWHLALYLEDWQGALERASAAGLAFDNARFSDRLADAAANHQFRTLFLGAGGPCLELEIRGRRHASCPLARA